MVNVVFTVVSLFVLVVAVATKAEAVPGDPQNVLSAESTPTLEPTPSIDPTETPVATVSATPTETPSQTPTPKPTVVPTAQNNQTSIGEWIYPKASVQANSSTNITLYSTDTAQEVTAWYKSKMKTLKFNVNTDVETKSNDATLNKLRGANADLSIAVDIKQDNASAPVSVNVSLTEGSSDGSVHVTVNNSSN